MRRTLAPPFSPPLPYLFFLPSLPSMYRSVSHLQSWHREFG